MTDRDTKSASKLLTWAEKNLAPETFERTMAAAWADVEHEVAQAPDAATRKSVARAGRRSLVRVLIGAMCHDRREHRRGLRWWLFGAPILAVLVGLVGLSGEATTAFPMIGQLAFVGAGLILGYLMASTPRRVIAHEAVAVGWIAALVLLLVPWLGVAADGSARWLAVGSLRVHMATLLMPFLALGVSRLVATDRIAHALGLVAVAQLAVMLTSDLGASLTLALASLAIAGLGASKVLRPRALVFIALPSVATVIGAALRDPMLAPSVASEGVLGALAASHALWLALAIVGLLLAIAAPLSSLGRGDRWSRALSAAVALALLVPLAANAAMATMVPLVGYGGSAIVATYLGLGAVLSLERSPTPAARARSTSR